MAWLFWFKFQFSEYISFSKAILQFFDQVAINFLTHQKEADQVCKQIIEKGGHAHSIQADVSKEKDVLKMVDHVKEIFGNVDVLINNAGIVHKEDLDKLTEDDWDRIMDINLKSAFLVTQHCLPGMRNNQWGRIIRTDH